MPTVGMTLDPHFTHTIVDLCREKTWYNGDPAGAEKLMDDYFGINNKKLIASIIRGEYVMVFNPDGSGETMHRDEVTQEAQDAMGGLPEYWDREKLKEMFRLRISRLRKSADEVVKYSGLVKDLYHEYTFNLGGESARLLNPAFNNTEIELDVLTTLKTKDLIQLWKRSKTDDASKKLCQAVQSANTNASDVLCECECIEEEIEKYKQFSAVLDYAEKYWESDIKSVDEPDFDGFRYTDPNEMLRDCEIKNIYNLTPYSSAMVSIMEQYQYLMADDSQQKLNASRYYAQMDQAQKEIEGHAEYIRKQHEDDINPVRIDERKWDAGWIAPDGTVWADCGPTSCLLHINLADKIFEYRGWTENDRLNRDRELEKKGYLKFHHTDISFTGYGEFGCERHKITNKQKDRLMEYAKVMGYDHFNTPFARKSWKVSDIYDMTDEEWANLLEW